MSNVAQKFDEETTKPVENTNSRAIVFAARVERLSTLALERLAVGADEDAIVAAMGDLEAIRQLAGTVLR